MSDDSGAGFRVKTVWSPTPLPQAPSATSPTPATTNHLRWPRRILVAALVIEFVAYWIPEAGWIPGSDDVLSQVAPMVSDYAVLLARPHPTDWPYGTIDTGLLLALLSALVLGTRGFQRLLGAPLTMALAALVAIGPLGASASALMRDHLGADVAAGAVLAVVVAWTALRGAWHVITAGAASESAHGSGGLGLLIAYAVLVAPAVAVGRAITGQRLAGVARDWVAESSAVTLLTPTTTWSWAAGVAAGIGLWGAVNFAFPRRPGVRLRGAVAFVVAVGALLGPLGNQASDHADQFAYDVRNTHPDQSVIGNYCQIWWNGSPERSVAFSGYNCSTVRSYEGYLLQSERTFERDFEVAEAFDPPPESTVPFNVLVISAAYDDVIIVAMRNQGARPGVLALDRDTGSFRWEFLCAKLPDRPSIRFSGSDTRDNAGSARITLPGDTVPAVYLRCGEGPVALNPAGGTPLG